MTPNAGPGTSCTYRRPSISNSVTSHPRMSSETMGCESEEVNDDLEGTKRALLDNSTFEDDNNLNDPAMELGAKVVRSSRSPSRSRRVHRQSNVKFVKEIIVETLPTLVLSTIGLTITGEMVEVVADWEAMSRIDELFILVPVLTNMKGNLEMNLSSRLGTAAYLGALDIHSSRQSIIAGNILLLQVQALLISALAGIFSFVLSWITKKIEGHAEVGALVRRTVSHLRDGIQESGPGREGAAITTVGKGWKNRKKPLGNSGFKEFIFVCCTSMSAASLSSFTLGAFMCTLVILCRRYNVDPDIIGPPTAAALGDLVTLFLLAVFSVIFLPLLPTALPLLFSLLLLAFTAFLIYCTFCNIHVRPLMKEGWTPLIGAMLITSFSGLVLDQFVDRYEGYGLLAIVITGLPGGVGSIFIARISTLLHAASPAGLLKRKGIGSNPVRDLEECTPLRLHGDMEDSLQGSRESFDNPVAGALVSRGPSDTQDINPHNDIDHGDARLHLFAGTLFAITFPVQILFFLFIHFAGWVEFNWAFVIVFMIMFSTTVLSTLFLANWLTYYLWSKGLDPDIYAMPILCSIVDVIGQFALVLCYEIATMLGSDMFTRDPS